MLCNDCHGMLSVHGDSYTDNVQVCATCHNPNLGRSGVSAGMKVMIHGIHDANREGRTNVTYPRHERLTNECNACHFEGTYYPQDTTTEAGFRLASTTDPGDDSLDPSDDTNTTFNAATCGSCHLDYTGMNSAVPMAHMTQNGSDFDVTQDVDGTLNTPFVETCVTCHGPGASEDVGVIHGVVSE
jgi:OmcA/MtrC family decaheme c-type cytochrome